MINRARTSSGTPPTRKLTEVSIGMYCEFPGLMTDMAGLFSKNHHQTDRLPRTPLIEGGQSTSFDLMCGTTSEKTISNPTDKGVEVCHRIQPRGLGSALASIKPPSGLDLSLYQPRHPTAYDFYS